MSAQIILSVLNHAGLLDDIRRAMGANTAYPTAFFHRTAKWHRSRLG